MDSLARMLPITQFVHQVSSLNSNSLLNHIKTWQRIDDGFGKLEGLIFEARRKKGVVIFIDITPTLTL
jgi:hypothetical protein